MPGEGLQFPADMAYLADDPLADVYHRLATALRTVYESTDLHSPARDEGIRDSYRQAREAGIPEGRISYISGLALSMMREQRKNEGN